MPATPVRSRTEHGYRGDMLPADIPEPNDLIDLIDHRDPASVSIAVESSPVPADHERIKIAVRNAIDDAHRELAGADLPRDQVEAVDARLRALLDDDEFWRHQSRSLIVFASTERFETFRLANRVVPHVAVGDRFDTGALLRAVAFDDRAYIVLIDEGRTRLYEFGTDHRPVELALIVDAHQVDARRRDVLAHVRAGDG